MTRTRWYNKFIMLTKSDFLNYLQCIKRMWLAKNRKDLVPEVDYNLQKRFDQGYEVEQLVYSLFPGGVSAKTDDMGEDAKKTKELIGTGEKIIFQPTFSNFQKNLYCRSDIIKRDEIPRQARDKIAPEEQSWDIYEVKSATAVSDQNIYDLAFQKICLEAEGLVVGKTFLIYINNQYVRLGDLDPKELFIIQDLTENVAEQMDMTKRTIAEAQRILETKKEPEVRILKQCKNPYECPFVEYCWKDLPAKSIYSIIGALTEEKLNKLLDMGIIDIKNIPDGFLKSNKYQRHIEAVRSEELYLEKDNIKNELGELVYPLYFLDYETFSPAIPLFDGYKPYQRMIFQYSLHIQATPDAECEHYSYLAKDFKDPSPGLLGVLAKVLGDKGSIVVWNAMFEGGCNNEMGERYPEYKNFMESVNSRLFDLMMIFKKGFFVHKDFDASSSLKKVLPVVVPELSYGGLDIQEGGTATNKWREMIDPTASADDKKVIYDNLIEYCELDTLAMVKILEKLEETIK